MRWKKKQVDCNSCQGREIYYAAHVYVHLCMLYQNHQTIRAMFPKKIPVFLCALEKAFCAAGSFNIWLQHFGNEDTAIWLQKCKLTVKVLAGILSAVAWNANALLSCPNGECCARACVYTYTILICAQRV